MQKQPIILVTCLVVLFCIISISFSSILIYAQNSQIDGLPSPTDKFGKPGTIIENEFVLTLKKPLQPPLDLAQSTRLTAVNKTALSVYISYLKENNILIFQKFDDGFAVKIPNNISSPAPTGINQTRKVTYVDIKEIFAPNAELPNVSNVSRPATNATQICKIILLNQDFKFCEPNVIGGTASIQTVPTGISRIGGYGGTHSVDLGAKNLTIAVMDSGISRHPDLNVIGNVTFIGDPKDNINHGTHVAGIIAAKDNSFGVIGVAPGAKLFSIKVLDNIAPNSPGGTDTFKKGLEYIKNNADWIKVVNLSITLGKRSDILNELMKEIVARGVTVIAAADNLQRDAALAWPGSISLIEDDAMVVGSIGDSDGKCGGFGLSILLQTISGPTSPPLYDKDDSFASNYSNFGPAVNMMAPGDNINSTTNNGSYHVDSGTSMAAAYVTGAAALYIAFHPGASVFEVHTALENMSSTSATICDNDGHGYYTTNDPREPKAPLLYIKPLLSP